MNVIGLKHKRNRRAARNVYNLLNISKKTTVQHTKLNWMICFLCHILLYFCCS